MYILGIGGWSHDASACLIKDGLVVGAAQEERFTRVKHQGGLPYHAISYCLSEAGISLEDVDHIGFYVIPWKSFRKNLVNSIATIPRDPTIGAYGLFQEVRDKGQILVDFHSLNSRITADRSALFTDSCALLRKVRCLDHHMTHAAGVYLTSPFDRSAILTVDGMGEWTTTGFYIGEGTRIRRLKEICAPHSLGAFYTQVTRYLGFEAGEDEYKVMGLASYGEPTYYDFFSKMVERLPQGGYRLNLAFFDRGMVRRDFSPAVYKVLGPPRRKGQPVEKRHQDIATSAQRVLEDVVMHMTEYLHNVTNADYLCLSGGVALNSVMNGRLAAEGHYKAIHVSPAAGDLGTAYGCAFYIYNTLLNEPRVYVEEHAYYGPEYSDAVIQETLSQFKLKYERVENVAKTVAELLADEKVVGWFQGRMEWGPRALGSRSILADPTRADMKDVVNQLVKRREEFRPFAPSVLEEKSAEYFDLKQPSPFMAMVCNVHPDKRDKIPAVTHVDGTARIQTVSQKHNPLYWQVIHEFGKITGVPVVLNTSFNVRGEPIICSPADAVRCFFSTGLDYLAIGSYLVRK